MNPTQTRIRGQPLPHLIWSSRDVHALRLDSKRRACSGRCSGTATATATATAISIRPSSGCARRSSPGPRRCRRCSAGPT